VNLYCVGLSYFELHLVLNVQGGILPVALNIVICSVVGVLDRQNFGFNESQGMYYVAKQI